VCGAERAALSRDDACGKFRGNVKKQSLRLKSERSLGKAGNGASPAMCDYSGGSEIRLGLFP
jgi:hypothetical protein